MTKKTNYNEKTITDFLYNDYREFAFYVLENRAIPSLIDGLKPSARKVIYVANNVWKTGTEKPMKVFQLGGKVASDSYYHHGDASLNNAIINLALPFKNNAPLLQNLGQYGTLRSPESGAPRYLETKLSDNFRLIYKDFNLLENKIEEGEVIEPNFFLPIIPMVLVNGGGGIAIGFASKILNRDVNDVINACINVLNGKKISNISPKIEGFNGLFKVDEDNHKKWNIWGTYERKGNILLITEIPPQITTEDYEKLLDELEEKKIINSYEIKGSDCIQYLIKFPKGVLDEMSDEKIVKLFKLMQSETENFIMLDEYNKFIQKESVEDIIKYFVNFRLGYFQKRKDNIIKDINESIFLLSNRALFIKNVLSGKIKVNNQPKSSIVEQISKCKLDMVDGSYDYLLRMPIYSLTKEVYEKLLSDLEEKKVELEKTESLDIKDMYLNDLKELQKNILKKNKKDN